MSQRTLKATARRLPAREVTPLYTEQALRERIKELRCLHGLRNLIALAEDSVPAVLEGLTQLLPPSWLHPDVTRARVQYDGHAFQSEDFRGSPWRLRSTLLVGSRQAGFIDVVYVERRPPQDIGPFLNEERELLDTVAMQTGLAICQIEQRRELKRHEQERLHREALLDKASDLARCQQQANVQMVSNVDKVVMPIVQRLEQSLSHAQRQQADMLRRSLHDLTSSHVNRLASRFSSLTPTELRICDAIRRDLSSKEIARIEGIAVGTVNRHRENIRRKLNLTHRAAHLATFLRSI